MALPSLVKDSSQVVLKLINSRSDLANGIVIEPEILIDEVLKLIANLSGLLRRNRYVATELA